MVSCSSGPGPPAVNLALARPAWPPDATATASVPHRAGVVLPGGLLGGIACLLQPVGRSEIRSSRVIAWASVRTRAAPPPVGEGSAAAAALALLLGPTVMLSARPELLEQPTTHATSAIPSAAAARY